MLLKPFYGLCDWGDPWHATLDEHFRLDLGLKQARLDPSLYALNPGKDLKGLVGTYVDDLLYNGKEEMRKISAKSKEKF